MSYLLKLITNATNDINNASNMTELENVRVKYLGKKGYLTLQITSLKEIPVKDRPAAGAIINKAKKQIQEVLNARKKKLENVELNTRIAEEVIDISLPGRYTESGSLHPITHTIDRIENFFNYLGFTVIIGPEIEDDYHNFSALNIPNYHPARANHDTFWFDTNRLLRTQTSGVQIRTMKNYQLPIRIIASGKVYRKDYDQTHTPMFHQVEGLIIDKNISFTNLKGTLHFFLSSFFEKKFKISFRPSYFPFTEPSAEVDIMDKNGKWLEIIGCGMVHPNVLHHVGINSTIYSGFAFGIGVERLAMLRYGVSDIRSFFENDLRFLKQFK